MEIKAFFAEHKNSVEKFFSQKDPEERGKIKITEFKKMVEIEGIGAKDEHIVRIVSQLHVEDDEI